MAPSIRSPTELVNLRVGDFTADCSKVTIREEVSKTFGRTINLPLCAKAVRQFITNRKLTETDRVFAISPTVVNRYLQRLARRVLGEGVSQAGERYPRLTMSDFRHSSACYWLRRYKSEAALKYRFGWKKTEQIHAYTRLLGMQDNITEDDLLVDARRTDLEWQLERAEGEKKLMQGQIDAMKAQLAQVLDVVSAMGRKIA